MSGCLQQARDSLPCATAPATGTAAKGQARCGAVPVGFGVGQPHGAWVLRANPFCSSCISLPQGFAPMPPGMSLGHRFGMKTKLMVSQLQLRPFAPPVYWSIQKS